MMQLVMSLVVFDRWNKTSHDYGVWTPQRTAVTKATLRLYIVMLLPIDRRGMLSVSVCETRDD